MKARSWNILGWTFGVAGASLLPIAGVGYGLYWNDRLVLRVAAEHAARGATTPAEKVLRLGRFVYHQHGFRHNEGFFLFPSMRATAAQVLAGGGDCADKSRLLVALLREVGVSATPFMCMHPRTGRPAHTAVEATIGPGEHMVFDPVFDLWFPKPNDGYFGLLELRNDSSILRRRLDELVSLRGRRTQVAVYNRADSVYAAASTVNWDKNVATRAAWSVLHPWLGEDIWRLRRPVVLEEPTLAAASLGAAIAAAMLSGGLGCRRRARCADRSASPAVSYGARPSKTTGGLPRGLPQAIGG
ncbi:MAG: transglutaminase domain-containing protein [Planctomycetota bacterium]